MHKEKRETEKKRWRGADSGLGLPLRQQHWFVFSALCGLASVFIQPLFFFTLGLHTVARLGNFISWNIRAKSSVPLS